MTKREKQQREQTENNMIERGFTPAEFQALRRISMTLRRWFEAECNGDIQRDEYSGIAYRHYNRGGRDSFLTVRVNDREKGAEKRLAAIMANHPGQTSYIQGDPRGASLYILRADQVKPGESVDSVYTRGICIY